MDIYTIGFTKKSAREFFETLRMNGIKRLIDVRLNNSSQLSGFSKRDDLAYFLKELCGAEYLHMPILAPTAELLDAYKKHGGSWNDYAKAFEKLIADRCVERNVDQELFAVPAVLLCSEHTAEHCHRRVVAEYLRDKWNDVRIVHI